MAEPQDAVMPVLQKIQKDISDSRKDVADFRKSIEAKVNDVAKNLFDVKEEAIDMRRDTLMHLGMTAKQRVDFDDLRAEVAEVKKRLVALEARS